MSTWTIEIDNGKFVLRDGEGVARGRNAQMSVLSDYAFSLGAAEVQYIGETLLARHYSRVKAAR